MKKLSLILIAVSLFCISGTVKPDSLDNSRESKDSLEIKIDTMIARMGLSSETPGGVVGVIKDGKLIFKKAYGLANFETKKRNKTSTLFNLGSDSKMFTAAAILLLANEKKLSLKDDIRKYLSDFPDYGYTITIENLIHHTSGIKSFDGLNLMAGTLESRDTQEENYNLIIKQKSLNFIPDAEYEYSNSGYLLLAKIIENVSGIKFSKFMEENIFRPAGMKKTFIYDEPEKIIKNSAEGHIWDDTERFKRSADWNNTIVGVSNVYTCAKDLLIWSNNNYENRLGKWDFGKEMTALTTLSNGDTCNYAFGLEISEYKGLRTISHQGGTGHFTAQYLQFPSERSVIVCLFNIPSDVTGLAYKITDLFVEGNPQPVNASIKPEKIKVDSSVMQLYAGKYFNENLGFGLTISREGDHLFFEAPYQGRFEIYPSSDTSFFLTVADVKFIFSKNMKGEVVKTTIIQDKQKINLTYLGANAVPLKAEQLSKYTGDFYCEEIGVSYPVLFKDSKLFIKFPESTAKFCKTKVESELISDHADYFASPVSGIQFTRNTNNKISGFIIKDVGRVRNLVFVLLKDPLTVRNKSANSKIDIMLMQGDYEKAIDTCKQILSRDSLNSEICYKMGIAYQNILEEELSLNCYSRAVSLNPDNNGYNFMLAKGYYAKGKFNLAEPLLRNLCAIDSLNWVYSYYLSSIYMQSNRYDDAINIYERFLKKDSTKYAYIDKMALAYLKKEDFEYATELYNKSLSINNKNLTAIKNLAYLYSAAMRPDTAIQLLTRGLEIDSSDVDIYIRRAQLNYSLYYNTRAIDDYLAVLSLGDSSKLYLKRIGICYCNILQPEEGIKYLQKAYEKDPSDYETCSYLGQSYYKLKDMENSIFYYARVIKILKPVNIQLGLTYILYAESQKDNGMYKDAIESYLKAQVIKPDPNIYMIIANLFDEKLNDKKNAVCYYQKFLDNLKDARMNFTPEYAETIKTRLAYLQKNPAK